MFNTKQFLKLEKLILSQFSILDKHKKIIFVLKILRMLFQCKKK